MLAPAHQGQGFGTEAVTALLEICFDRLGLRRVTAGCFVRQRGVVAADGDASACVARATRCRDGLHRDRGWLDGYEYALLADEWALTTS